MSMVKMDENLAIVFPGQGSQSVGMLADFYSNFVSFKNVLAEASDKLNYDLWRVITNDNQEQLNRTEFTQPAIVAVSVALWQIWQQEGGIIPKFVAGHSVGEYSALVAAQVLDFADAISLVSERGRLMQNAVATNEGAMAAIIGLADSQVESLCRIASIGKEIVVPANFNAPGQVVVAGNRQAVLNAEIIARAEGARRVVLLDVSVPSHCVLMQSAASELANILQDTTFHTPEISVIHNFDVTAHTDKQAIKDALIQQLCSPVQWTETIKFFAKQNIKKVLECGPGKVLTGLNKRISREISCSAIGDLNSFKQEINGK